MKNITGYHIYYQSKEFEKYREIDLMVQLTSALFWKKKFGPIKLYCNERFLNTLKIWNLDKCYDEINVELLENIPYKNYLSKYWSFCKIYTIKHISQIDEKFVVLDTDLFIKKDLGLDLNKDLILYHKEVFKEDQLHKTYLLPSTFLSEDELKGYDWDILPTNAAFLYINNQEMVNKWYDWVIQVIENNKDKIEYPDSADTVFIEQRLLPTLVEKMGLDVGFVFDSTYKTWVDGVDDLSDWEPKLDSTEELQFRMDNSRHIWGLKNSYRFVDIRQLILYSSISSLREEFQMSIIESKYSKLFDICYEIFNDESNSIDPPVNWLIEKIG